MPAITTTTITNTTIMAATTPTTIHVIGIVKGGTLVEVSCGLHSCTKTLNASVSVPSSATLLATQVYLVLLSLKMVALMVSALSTISNSLGRAMMVGSLKLTLGSRVKSNVDPSLSHWMSGAGTPVAVHEKVRESVTLTI